MNKNSALLFASVFLFLSSACVTTGKYRQMETRAGSLEGQLSEAAGRIETLEAQISQLNDEIAMLTSANEDLSAALTEKRGELQKRVSKMNTEKLELEKQVADLEKARDDLARAQKEKLDQMKSDYENLVQGLKKDIEEGQIMITQLEGKLTVNVADKIFFDSGKATLNKNGRDILGRLGKVMESLKDKQVVVEGHTDNAPIGQALKEKFPSNWELSTARATEVVRFLEEKVGIEPSRLIAVGYGASRPVAKNDSPDGRSKNRRIEIVFQDRNWNKVEKMEKPVN